jgi:hypothetical protein
MLNGLLVEFPSCTVRLNPDLLFERMAEPTQGWHVQSEIEDVWPPLSALDLVVIEAARLAAQKRTRLAVGVSRVVTGIALGPVVYTALNALIQQSPYAIRPGFSPFPIEAGGRIVLASRSHAVRDMLAESLLKFEQKQTRLAAFPTFRLARQGNLEPGVFGRLPKQQRPRPQDMMRRGPSILVYDYWPYGKHIDLPRVAAVFAELAESDSVDTIERLSDFISRTNPRLVLAIVNLNDVEKRKRLTALGFELFVAQTSHSDGVGIPLPSFTGVDRVAPKQVDVAFEFVSTDEPVNEPLSEAFQLLAEAQARVPPGEQPPLSLLRAWYVLDHLAGCPGPLTRYEELRRRDPREQSLRFRLEKMESVNWGLVGTELRGVLMARWPHIVDSLRKAYSILLDSNPKWWQLAGMILDAREPFCVLLSNRLSAQTLRDELLIGFEWSESQSPVKVRSLAEARRNDESFERVVLLGGWKDWQRPYVFGMLPQEVRVLGYPYEAFVLGKRLQQMQTDVDVTLTNATRATLSRLLDGQFLVPVERTWRSVDWDSDAVNNARRNVRLSWNQRQYWQRPDIERDDEVLFETAAVLASTRDSQVSADDSDDELVAAVTIWFTDGTGVSMPVDRELLVLPHDADVTEQRFALDVKKGDRVLLLSAGDWQDVFAAAVARTRHLIRTDPRITERWRDTLIRIRQDYPREQWGKGTRFCEAMEQLGCIRDRVTMRSWLSGSTMAPRDSADIAYLLRLGGGLGDVDAWAELISHEMNLVRDFHRRIGRRIARHVLAPDGGERAGDRVDEEIDELLEDVELRIVAEVSSVAQRPKHQLARIREDDEL